MVSGTQFDVDETHPMLDELTKEKKTWWEMRPVMLQMPPATWVYIKSLVILACKKTGKCKDKEIESWNRTQARIDADLEKRKGK